MHDARDERIARNSWDIVEGCTKVAPGCKNCYVAYHMGDRFRRVRPREDRLNLPLMSENPRSFFVTDTGDLLHEAVPDEFIGRVIGVMRATPQHRYFVCTKRPHRLASFSWPANVALGVSVDEVAPSGFIIEHLKPFDGNFRFVSAQPLLGPIRFDFYPWLDWVVAGGEYGAGARPLDDEWVRMVRTSCALAGIPFTYQQRQREDGTRELFPELDGQKHIHFPTF